MTARYDTHSECLALGVVLEESCLQAIYQRYVGGVSQAPIPAILTAACPPSIFLPLVGANKCWQGLELVSSDLSSAFYRKQA